MEKKKTSGRPAGTHNCENMMIAVIPASCPTCRSTEKESIRILIERYLPGIMPNGQPRTHIVWRRVRCRACGQYYTEQEHQNRVDQSPE